MARPEKSKPPMITPTMGMMISFTSELMIAPNAPSHDHGNSQVEHVATQDEIPEFF